MSLFHSKRTSFDYSHRIKSNIDRGEGVREALLAVNVDTLLPMRRASCRAIS